MFNSGRQYNNGNNVNVNTRLYTSYSDTAMVVMGAWNSQLSLKVHPFKGLNAEGVRQYAQDNTEIINTSITVDNAHALIEAIDSTFQPAVDNKTEASVGIQIGTGDHKKSLTLSTDGNEIYLIIAIGVDDNGVAQESNIIKHKFNKRSYVIDYNPLTGSGTEVMANVDYDSFVAKVRAIENLVPTIAHSINYSNQLRQSYSSRNVNQNNYGGNNYQAPTSNYGAGDMSDFLPMN